MVSGFDPQCQPGYTGAYAGELFYSVPLVHFNLSLFWFPCRLGTCYCKIDVKLSRPHPSIHFLGCVTQFIIKQNMTKIHPLSWVRNTIHPSEEFELAANSLGAHIETQGELIYSYRTLS